MPYYFSYNMPAYEYAPKGLSPQEGVARLKEGNKRFMAEALKNERFSAARRLSLVEGQSPFAVIVSCSDSRVPPEEIFDQGLGELFVVRTAGHVADESALGSIEYAVAFLGASLVVVLGHEDCGAVCAAMSGKQHIGYMKSVVEAVKPAVEGVRASLGNDLCAAVQANVRYVVERIKKAEPYLSSMVAEAKVQVVGAVYTFHDGKVTFLDL